MPEEYWAGFRPQPQKVSGELKVVELTTETSLELPNAFARVTTKTGFESWGAQVRKLDVRPGGRIDVTLWQELEAEGAFASIDLGKSVEFTLDSFGLVRFSFSESSGGTTITLKCSRIVEVSDWQNFEASAERLLKAVSTN